MVCDKVEMEEAEEEEAEEAAGYRIKNKNPTQRCGELQQQLLPQLHCSTLQLQIHYLTLDYTTLYHTTRGEVTTATISTIPENTTPTTFRSISGFALPSVSHNNQPFL